MPKITISEKDLTSPGFIDNTSNIVYVPGLAKRLPKDFKENTPRLYTTLSSFQYDFGDKVPTIGLGTLSSTNYPGFGDGGAYDTGYIYATELLRLGCPVLYDCFNKICTNDSTKYIIKNPTSTSGGTTTSATIPTTAGEDYWLNVNDDDSYMRDTYATSASTIVGKNILRDKGLYNIKFVSNGGYEEFNNGIIELAAARQDCVALPDIKYINKKFTITSTTTAADILSSNDLSTLTEGQAKYSALFAPWATYELPCIKNYVNTPATTAQAKTIYYPSLYEMPGSFGYLMAMASAIQSGASNWVAMAGASRGQIPYLKEVSMHITEAIIDILQTRNGKSINPITTINPFGVVVWGNRTLYDNSAKGNLTASSFLNIRNLCSDVKKTVWTTARRMTFEQNSDILWVNFKSHITPLLDQMVTSGCLSGYELKKRANKQKAELRAVVRLYPIEAVEDFEIEIQLADDTTTTIEA